jgi:hypothetical protein
LADLRPYRITFRNWDDEIVGETDILSEHVYAVGDTLEKLRRSLLQFGWNEAMVWSVHAIDESTDPPTLTCIEVITA